MRMFGVLANILFPSHSMTSLNNMTREMGRGKLKVWNLFGL